MAESKTENLLRTVSEQSLEVVVVDDPGLYVSVK